MPWIILAALAIGYAGYVAFPVVSSLRETKELMREARPYAQSPADPTMRILVMGDSTAVGTGSAPEESIAGRLGARYPGALIVNESENGMKLEEFVRRINAREGERYDLVVMQIGANDIVGLTSERDIRARLGEALGRADSLAPRTIVICAGNVGLAPVFKWPASALYTARARSVRALYLEEVAKHPSARYVDLFNEREDEPFNKDIDRYYARDHFHPSGAGYGIWFGKLEPFLPA